MTETGARLAIACATSVSVVVPPRGKTFQFSRRNLQPAEIGVDQCRTPAQPCGRAMDCEFNEAIPLRRANAFGALAGAFIWSILETAACLGIVTTNRGCAKLDRALPPRLIDLGLGLWRAPR